MGRRSRNSIARGKRVSPSRLVPSLKAVRAATARSSITNGTRLLPGVLDHRSAWARRLYDLVASYTSDLGGDQNLSEAERALVRRISMVTLQLELMEARFAASETGEASAKMLDRYLRASGTLNRLCNTIGLKRRAREVVPTLDEYSKRLEAAE
jgi:hypothetical protein